MTGGDSEIFFLRDKVFSVEDEVEDNPAPASDAAPAPAPAPTQQVRVDLSKIFLHQNTSS